MDLGRRPGPMRRAVSAWSACPRARFIRSAVTPRPGIDPFLARKITVTDTEGLKPIETTLELPRGVIVIGRLMDQATGRPVFARDLNTSSCRPTRTRGATPTIAAVGGPSRLTDPAFRLTVPPGEGMICAGLSAGETPYTRARLSQGRQGEGRSAG